MSDDMVIRVENLWKRYGTTVGAELKRLLSFRRNSQGAPVEDHGLWALWDINFEVRRGKRWASSGATAQVRALCPKCWTCCERWN